MMGLRSTVPTRKLDWSAVTGKTVDPPVELKLKIFNSRNIPNEAGRGSDHEGNRLGGISDPFDQISEAGQGGRYFIERL